MGRPQGVHAEQVIGLPVRGPAHAPAPGSVLVGWEVVQPSTGCCVCDSLSVEGWLAFALLLLFFWPLAWLPCLMDSCHQMYQRPVYGPPGSGPPAAAGAQQPVPVAVAIGFPQPAQPYQYGAAPTPPPCPHDPAAAPPYYPHQQAAPHPLAAPPHATYAEAPPPYPRA